MTMSNCVGQTMTIECSGEYSSYLSARALAATGITRGMEGCGGEVLRYWDTEILRY